MNFIKINLNQTVSKAQREFIIEEKNRWYIFTGICLLFVASFIWFLVIFIPFIPGIYFIFDKITTEPVEFHW